MGNTEVLIKRTRGRPAKYKIEPCPLPKCGYPCRIMGKPARSRKDQPNKTRFYAYHLDKKIKRHYVDNIVREKRKFE